MGASPKGILLSQYAKRQLDSAWSSVKTMMSVLLFVFGSVTFSALLTGGYGLIVLFMAPYVVWFLLWPYRKYRKRRKDILEFNEQDFYKADHVRETLKVLDTFNPQTHVLNGVETPPGYRVFRVEYEPSSSLQGAFQGEYSGGMFGGQMSGTMSGRNTPNMHDMSTVLFLRNEAGDTERVLVPNPAMLKAHVRKAFGLGLSGEHNPTHCDAVVNDFFARNYQRLISLQAIEVVDRLAAECADKAFDDRSDVRVTGVTVGAGVSLAGAIALPGKSPVVVYPHTMMSDLTGVMRRIPQNPAPQLAYDEL